MNISTLDSACWGGLFKAILLSVLSFPFSLFSSIYLLTRFHHSVRFFQCKIYSIKYKYYTFPRKHSLGISKLHFIGWRHGHVDNCFSEVPKLWISFEAWKLEVWFAQITSIHELIGYVDLSDFNKLGQNTRHILQLLLENFLLSNFKRGFTKQPIKVLKKPHTLC